MVAVAAAQPGSLASSAKLITLASLGGALDYFDFVIFAIFARYIAAGFFPAADPVVSVLFAFLLYAVGFFVRPIGAVVLSHFGDKYGRRPVFVGALLGMSVATFLIGVLPTYAQWGITATVLLVALRLLQGLSVGGEVPGAMAYVVETEPRRACLYTGFVQFLVVTGILLATGMNYALQSLLTPEQLASFGWRIPFLVGGLLGTASYFMRRSLHETPVFASLKASTSRLPLSDLFARFKAPLAVGMGVSVVTAAFNGLLFAYMPVYLTTILKYDGLAVARAMNVALATYAVGLLVCAWAGDKLPREWILRVGGAVVLVGAYPFYASLVSRGADLTVLAAVAGLAGAPFAGIFACVLADLFPARVRFSGSALATNVATAIFSGLTPFIATTLIARTGSSASPAFYLILAAIVCIVFSLWLPRYAGQIEADAR